MGSYNVTEDADLGLRFAALGYNVSVVNSVTLEEANAHFGSWIRQRSRWIKGDASLASQHAQAARADKTGWLERSRIFQAYSSGDHRFRISVSIPLRIIRNVGCHPNICLASLVSGPRVSH